MSQEIDAVVAAVEDKLGLWPHYQDDMSVIFKGDCLEILPCLLSDSIDLILSDPPYGVSYVSNMRKNKDDPLAMAIANDSNLNIVGNAIAGLDRVLKNDRHVYLFASALRIGESVDLMSDLWHIKNILIWDKGNTGTVGDLEAGYSWNWEPIIYAAKGRRALNRISTDGRNARPRSVFRHDWQGASFDSAHPTVKPIAVLQWLIGNSSLEGEVVLDPFCGSGTTLKAAKDLRRLSIGIELEEKYCEEAADRLRRKSDSQRTTKPVSMARVAQFVGVDHGGDLIDSMAYEPPDVEKEEIEELQF